jgi:hypothetical protein
MAGINRDFFLSQARLALFDGNLSARQSAGLAEILDFWEASHARKDDRWLAYILATAHHEVDRTMQPIREYGGASYFRRLYDIAGANPRKARELGNLRPGDGVLFHGRGYVQLTGRANYAFWEKRLGIDLTSGPAAADRVLERPIAVRILVDGMIEGTFTGKRLAQYLDGARADWEGARRIINGTDKKALIASYARRYYSAISYTTG